MGKSLYYIPSVKVHVFFASHRTRAYHVKVKSPGNSSERWIILSFTVIRKIIGAFSFLFSFFDTWYIIKYFHITCFFPERPTIGVGYPTL